jgi:hypothetical protein
MRWLRLAFRKCGEAKPLPKRPVEDNTNFVGTGKGI